MWKYVVKRLILVFFTAFIVLSITFLLYKSLPLDIPLAAGNEGIMSYLDTQVRLGYVIRSTERLEGFGDPLTGKGFQAGSITVYYYLRPIMEQWASWIKNIFTAFDWGVSSQLYPNQSAMGIILNRLPVTVEINIYSLIISLPLGILFGIIAALNKGKVIDNVLNVLVMIVLAVPSFITILYAILIFSYQLGWLPDRFDTGGEIVGANAYLRYIIPVFSLALGTIAGFTRFVRAELCEVMSSDYLLLARTKGLTKRQSIIRHALRNSMVPVVPMIIAEFLSILSGSMILENLYNIRGVGGLYMQAYNSRDWNLLLANTAFYTIIGLTASILVDLSYGFIDPRIRMGAKK